MNLERKETEVCLDLRVLEVARVMLVLVVHKVLSAHLDLLEFLAPKDKRDLRDQLVQLVRREILD